MSLKPRLFFTADGPLELDLAEEHVALVTERLGASSTWNEWSGGDGADDSLKRDRMLVLPGLELPVRARGVDMARLAAAFPEAAGIWTPWKRRADAAPEPIEREGSAALAAGEVLTLPDADVVVVAEGEAAGEAAAG